MAERTQKVAPPDCSPEEGEDDHHSGRHQQFGSNLPHLNPYIGEVRSAQEPRKQSEGEDCEDASTPIHQ
jgi:hypothetical protein